MNAENEARMKLLANQTAEKPSPITLAEFDAGVTLNADGSAHVRLLDLRGMRAALEEIDRLNKDLATYRDGCVRDKEEKEALKKSNEELAATILLRGRQHDEQVTSYETKIKDLQTTNKSYGDGFKKVSSAILEARWDQQDVSKERDGLNEKNARLISILIATRAALDSWVKVMDSMRNDPDDPATAIREQFHGKRLQMSRDALALLPVPIRLPGSEGLGIMFSEPRTFICWGKGSEQETVAEVQLSHKPECLSIRDDESDPNPLRTACTCDERERREDFARLIVAALEGYGWKP